MKNLYLVRHGEADWSDYELDDQLRPLTARGTESSHKLGYSLMNWGVKPDVIMSSPAIRALQTANILAQELNYPASKVKINDKIYFSENVDSLMNFIQLLPNRVFYADNVHNINTVIIVGHNPELTQLVYDLRQLDFSSDPIEMPPSSVAKFTFNVSAWTDILDGDNTEFHYIVDESNIDIHDNDRRTDDYMNFNPYLPKTKELSTIKDLIEHLQTLDETLPITIYAEEIGSAMSIDKAYLKDMFKVEEIDYLDDEDCTKFKGLLIG